MAAGVEQRLPSGCNFLARFVPSFIAPRLFSTLPTTPSPPPLPSFTFRTIAIPWAPTPKENVEFVIGRRPVTPKKRRIQIVERGISRDHAVIQINSAGHLCVKDLGSQNGTFVLSSSEFDAPVTTVGKEWVLVPKGSTIRLSHYHHFTLQLPAIPSCPHNDFEEAAESSSLERTLLIERLAEAQEAGREVEIFLRETAEDPSPKEKLAGRIVRSDGNETVVQEGLIQISIPLENIVTIRGRGQQDLISEYIHVKNPQYPDKSVNKSGKDGKRMWVLVDFSDPRLTDFLDEYIEPIRTRFVKREISERDAAEEARQVVHNRVEYDHGRSHRNHLFRLGDFMKKAVCNERGMILQVCFQHIGIEGTQMEKGLVEGGQRHAWVRARELRDGSGKVHDLILDPREEGPMDVESAKVQAIMALGWYVDDDTPFAEERMGTLPLNCSAPVNSQKKQTKEIRK